MNIGFNFLRSGLGNNGGTRTILKSAEVLTQLGHRVDLISTIDKFTWFEHPPIRETISSDLDTLVATACTTVESTNRSSVRGKAWYIRGHETWTKSERELQRLYRGPQTNIANSNGMRAKLRELGADASVVYQGVDLELWKDLGIRSAEKIRIGCLYHDKPTKRWTDFVALAKKLGTSGYEFVGYGAKPCRDSFLSEYYTTPSIEELNRLYSSCHVWFAPTVLEGLHNVPMEAALCGCLIVCNDVPTNGMILDYAFANKTAMVYGNLDEAVALIQRPNWGVVQPCQMLLQEQIGGRGINMLRFVEILKNGM